MSVTEQLKRLFPSMTINKLGLKDPEAYEWFQTADAEVVGIRKDELNPQASHLLSVFLKPLSSEESTMTEREKKWASLLQKNVDPQEMVWPLSYRFVLFSIDDDEVDPGHVKEAFTSIFPYEAPLLWTSHKEGFMIEEIFNDEQETMEFEGMDVVLMSDFYTNIHFFISEFSSDRTEAQKILHWADRCARIAREHKLGSITTYKDTIPYLYLNALPQEDWEHIQRAIFKGMEHEQDLLQTIRTYLESGANTTLAAKKLYMHRNSLQYRVDKFIEKTGLDIKQFEGAVITYLALLHMDY